MSNPVTGNYNVTSIWTEPIMGNTRNDRIGNQIMTRWLTFRAYITFFSSGSDISTNSFIPVRVVLFTWKTSNLPSSPNLSDMFMNATSATEALTAPFETSKIRVLKSWNFVMTPRNQGSTNMPNNNHPVQWLTFSRPYKRRMRWDSNSTVLGTAEHEPYVCIVTIPPNGTGNALSETKFNYSCKISYVDI